MKTDPIKPKPDIFEWATDQDLEAIIPYLFGDEVMPRLRELAAGRCAQLLSVVREGIYAGLEEGAFDEVQGGEKRTGNDERLEWSINQRIRAVIGHEGYMRVSDAAREKRISNLAMLRAGFTHSLMMEVV